MSPLSYEIRFGDHGRVAIEFDGDIFELEPAQRDAFFAFVDAVKAIAGNGAAPQPVTPPQPSKLIPGKPRFVRQGGAPKLAVRVGCDQCDRTFDTQQGLTLHKRRAHEGYDPRATMPTPMADAVTATITTTNGVLELTCETCNAPLPSIEKLKTHTIARHGRDPRPTELVENRGPR